MSKTYGLYLDCTTGVSGDMVLAALLDLGVHVDTLKSGLEKLNLGAFHLEVREEEHYDQRGQNVYFSVTKEEKNHHSEGESEHDHHHHQGHHGERSFREIEKMIKDSILSEGIKNRALAIYETIGEAEAKVHETDLDHVHFHEVGRDTAILNIVGVAICMELLGIERVYCSELHDGTGFITCSHGTIPVPVPAVQALLKDMNLKLVQEDCFAEMVTPSGLGILKGLGAIYLEKMPTGSVKTGAGFGKKDLGRLTVVTADLLDKS